MADSYSEVWSTLGYGALGYFWGIPLDEVDQLADSEKARLAALTTKVVKMSEHDRGPILQRLEGIPHEKVLPALQELASELLP